MSADLDVTSDHDGTGYTLVITWDKPISSFEQWSGDASSDDQKYLLQTFAIIYSYTNIFLEPGQSNQVMEFPLEQHSVSEWSWDTLQLLTWLLLTLMAVMCVVVVHWRQQQLPLQLQQQQLPPQHLALDLVLLSQQHNQQQPMIRQDNNLKILYQRESSLFNYPIGIQARLSREIQLL